jgi:hypothetical protein
MRKTKGYIDPNRIVSMCAWCGKKIPKGSEIFSLGAKARPGIDLHTQTGRAIRLLLAKSQKTVNAIVPTDTSQAKKDGNDFVFALCGPQCAEALRQALQAELDVFEQVNDPPPN